jgi:isochorismate synthase
VIDTLKYRLPGKEIVEQLGTFRSIDFQSIQKGFVLTDFSLKNCFVFEASSEMNDKKAGLHFLKKHPFVIEKENYLTEAASFIASFQYLNLKKGVYSRVKNVAFDEQKAETLFFELASNYPNSFVYFVSSDLFGTWVGATPEVLLSIENEEAKTISLAGTKKSNDESAWNAKEKEEQDIVTQYIEHTIAQSVKSKIEVNGPYEYIAGPVKHLRTDFSFNLANESALNLIQQLHPTPAVSGLPKENAIELINKTEKHERSLYTGVIGLLGEETTNLFVNLRCCQLTERSAFLYLGGGFTKDSVPTLEWEETENKSQTLLNIFQKL